MMLKFSPILRGMAVAGLIAATPAIAAGLAAPTQTRSSSSMLTGSPVLLSTASTTMMSSATGRGRGSPILVPGDSTG